MGGGVDEAFFLELANGAGVGFFGGAGEIGHGLVSQGKADGRLLVDVAKAVGDDD